MLLDRIKNKIIIEEKTDCWLWVGAKQTDGYGCFGYEKKVHLAHRKIYQIIKGEIEKGLELDHLCKNRNCVNPDHLEPVTHKENILRGISPSAKNKIKTHCDNGHEFTENNTMRLKRKTGGEYRVCRVCARKAKNACMARKKLINKGD